ncbi:MAG: hypothetical protein QE271_11905 [Bacteriovoracaceae bacterium]|nr:hypothetical protein [Bacteriovoracaceae bacterium]
MKMMMKLVFAILVLFTTTHLSIASDFVKCDFFEVRENSKILLTSGKIDLDSQAFHPQQIKAMIKTEGHHEFAVLIIEKESPNTLKANLSANRNSNAGNEKVITYFEASGMAVFSEKPLNFKFSTTIGSFEIQCVKLPFRDRRE